MGRILPAPTSSTTVLDKLDEYQNISYRFADTYTVQKGGINKIEKQSRKENEHKDDWIYCWLISM